jgi:hypothetical protein
VLTEAERLRALRFETTKSRVVFSMEADGLRLSDLFEPLFSVQASPVWQAPRPIVVVRNLVPRFQRLRDEGLARLKTCEDC